MKRSLHTKPSSSLHPIFDEIASAFGLQRKEACAECWIAEAKKDGLCNECWGDINDQFGVGA